MCSAQRYACVRQAVCACVLRPLLTRPAWPHHTARLKGRYDLFGLQQLKAGGDGAAAVLTLCLCSFTPACSSCACRELSRSSSCSSSRACAHPAFATRARAGEEPYAFDAKAGPRAVFERFFGTANPYEALEGK